MHNLSEVTAFLINQGIKLSGPLARQDGKDSEIYIFAEISKDSNGHQKPTNIFLKQLSQQLLKNGFAARFILNDVSNRDFEAGLRATLIHAFPRSVRNSFLSFGSDGAIVWIVPKGLAARDQISEIKQRVLIFLQNADLELDEVKLTVDEDLPSRTAILSELRIAAPASIETLAERLLQKGFIAPPLDYLARHLDSLRRAGQVIRRKDARYCLTANALKILGTVKRRNSADITRFLDLARRGDLQ